MLAVANFANKKKNAKTTGEMTEKKNFVYLCFWIESSLRIGKVNVGNRYYLPSEIFNFEKAFLKLKKALYSIYKF